MTAKKGEQKQCPADGAEVNLSPREMIQGAFVGLMRQVENIAKGRRDAYGISDGFGWQAHIEGALGEMAVAKTLNRFWSGAHQIRAEDIAGLEVRTRSKHNYDLIVHPNDKDDSLFVLVTGLNGAYRVRGCIRGCDAKRTEWWKDPAGGRPAFFVPQAALEKMEVLECPTDP